MDTAIKVRGFFRVAIEDDGKIVGDSGYLENQVTNLGKRDYLARALGAIAGSLQVNRVALGTGGAPASDGTVLAGEVQQRTTLTAATNGSSAVRFTATFASGGSFVTATQNISNIGLFNSQTGGTLFAGNTYASSSCATNQNVNVTYDITFS
jgi:hypothetical protein